MQTPQITLNISTYRYSSIVYLRNERPVLWNVELQAEQELEHVKLRVRHEPEGFAEPQEWDIPFLAERQLYSRAGECPAFNDAALLAQKEDVPGRIIVELVDAEGLVLARREDTFKWLAYNTWAGGNEYPELLAALTLPQDPAVDDITNAIGTGKGYAAQPEEILSQLQQLWEHVAGLGIEYALPPKSWIDDGLGQRVRTPSCIMESKCSTCLDSTLLLAACVTRLGLNPFVILIDGHAFMGVQLQNRHLPSPQLTPASTIRNHLKQQRLIVLETTALNTQDSRKPISFNHAAAVGSNLLENLAEDAYFQALDIKSLWYQVGIHPILGELPKNTNPAPTAEEADNLVSHMPHNRMDVWQLKLLDLSLRNPLLNTRTNGKQHISLLLPNVTELEDKLSTGTAFRIKSIPETYWSITSQVQHGKDSDANHMRLAECVTSMFTNRELASLEPNSALQKQLHSIYLATRREMEESGANTLYIACGFLKWYRSNVREQRAFRAPVLLLPVQLSRPSVKAGFTLRGTDEEPRFNMTLLELLKTEFGINIPELEGELPTDEAGLDVPRIFNILRRAIDSLPGWEVEERCILGTFSFTKYLMWKDLCDRREHLMRNPIVSQIAASERGIFPAQVSFPAPSTLDNEVDAQKVFTPLSADSSQLSAVLAAGRGKNFVLIGPPGTGKSQTITNMIAHCLAHGKTVLFVAEKAAALQVVHKRLKRVGLEPFCLELHSNKANKKDVLAQYKAAVETISEGSTKEDWENRVYAMTALRQQLNQLPEELHKLYPDETSLFNDIDLIATHQEQPNFTVYDGDILTCSRQEKIQLLETARDLVLHYELVRPLTPSQRELLNTSSYTPAWEDELTHALLRYQEQLNLWEQTANDAGNILGLPAEHLRELLPALELADKHPGAGLELLLPARSATTLSELAETATLAEQFRELKAQLSLPYPPSVTQADDLKDKLKECRDITISGFFTRFFGMRRMRRYLQMLSDSRQKPTDCLKDLQNLVRMQDISHRLHPKNAAALPRLFRLGLDTTQQHVAEASSIAATLGTIREADALLHPVFAAIHPELHRLVDTMRSALSSLSAAEDALQAATQHPICSRNQAEELLNLRHLWRNIVLWNRRKQNCHPAWVQAIQQDNIAPEDFPTAVEVNLARLRLRTAAAKNETLLQFVPTIHEGRITDFARKDTDLLNAATTQIRNSLIQRAGSITKHGTEVALLQRELSKQRAHMPLRRLLTSIPHLTPLLKPCMLMSPLSVAQYLTTDAEPFDVVIFDEASQIPVWDAIGAIGRGRNAIIVGDPRQMPPTSFFSRSKDEDEEDDGTTEKDMESILDECLACNIPSMNLCWHYRSKSESLIAFSNDRYYEQQLTTFPAPRMQDHAIHYHHTSGIYEPGTGKRINRQEAAALVAHVVSTLRSPGFRYTEATSIGIVTFNTQQQALIQDLLEAERANDETLEPYFAENNPEAIFVKNLENVQGDERGVIYFSTTFGPDAKGRMSMNFGPLNLQGGERRLNVAITRARNGMHIFTSILPENIDLSRTKARGAADLRGFLDYARRGAAAYMNMKRGIRSRDMASLTAHLAEELTARGWNCQTGVGVSGYRIDLAVEAPSSPGNVLAGITTDGYPYASANTARDRDVLRPSVLQGLGWRLLRVWAMDWWRSPAACIEALDVALKHARTQGPPTPPKLPELSAPSEEISREITSETPPPTATRENIEPGPAYQYARMNTTLPPLFEMSDASLQPVLCRIVEEEGPMKEDFLLARLREFSLTPAISPSLRRRLSGLLTRLIEEKYILSQQEGSERILYTNASEPVKPRSKGPREWSDVPNSELRAIATQVLARLKCMPGCDEHLKGVATYLGFARLTKPLREYLTQLLTR